MEVKMSMVEGYVELSVVCVEMVVNGRGFYEVA